MVNKSNTTAKFGEKRKGGDNPKWDWKHASVTSRAKGIKALGYKVGTLVNHKFTCT